MTARTRRVYARFSSKQTDAMECTHKDALKYATLAGRWCAARQINGSWYVVNLQTRRIGYLSMLGIRWTPEKGRSLRCATRAKAVG